MSIKPIVFSLLFITSFSFGKLYAQDSGLIFGNARDKYTQAPAAGATIVIDGSNASAVADSNGNYKLETTLGVKNVTITFSGYAPQTKYNIVVTSGNAQVVNFELE